MVSMCALLESSSRRRATRVGECRRTGGCSIPRGTWSLAFLSHWVSYFGESEPVPFSGRSSLHKTLIFFETESRGCVTTLFRRTGCCDFGGSSTVLPSLFTYIRHCERSLKKYSGTFSYNFRHGDVRARLRKRLHDKSLALQEEA